MKHNIKHNMNHNIKCNRFIAPLGTLTTVIFLIIGFTVPNGFIYAWPIFLINPIYYWFASQARKKEERQKAEKKDSNSDWTNF